MFSFLFSGSVKMMYCTSPVPGPSAMTVSLTGPDGRLLLDELPEELEVLSSFSSSSSSLFDELEELDEPDEPDEP